MPFHPEVLWAQRSSETSEEKNILYVTVNLPDIIPDTLKYDLTPTTISFAAKAGNAAKGLEERDYEFKFDLFAEVVPEQSKQSLTSRHLALVIRKKEKQAEYWPRLTKEKVKSAFIKTDFSKWVDEDEQDGVPVADEDLDLGGMGGMPGMPGMGGLPGMGGPGGMDFEAMMKSMGGGAGLGDLGGAGGPSASGEPESDDDDDDEGPPPLEEA